MNFTGKLVGVTHDWFSNKIKLTFDIDQKPSEEINELLSFDKLSIEAKKWSKKRSLDANAYLWVLCTKIANHPQIKSSKDEIYEEMLQKYGYIYQDEDGYITVTVKSEVDMNKIAGHWKFYKGNGQFSSYLMIKGSSE